MPSFWIPSRISKIILSLMLIGWLASIDSAFTQTLSQRLKKRPLAELVTNAKRLGNAQQGALAFHNPVLNCAKCHEANSVSMRRLGPNLNEKREVDWAYLVTSILDPSAKIKEGFGSAQVLLDDGTTVTGVLLEETDSFLRIDRIEEQGKPLKINKEEIDLWKKVDVSTMPEGLANQLANEQQFYDLIRYLADVAKHGSELADSLKPADAVVVPLPAYEANIDHAGLIQSWNRDALERGKETYRLRCASCHGTKSAEGSMPTSLRFGKGVFKRGSDPYSMYQTLTHGYGMMNPQRWMVPQQKYEVIHYIRERFLKDGDPSQRFEVTDEFLASLPKGDTRGPKPVVLRPWSSMDYGHSFNNTIEVGRGGKNIAQKGIVIRLDDGPGGVAAGQHWMMYEHDTMRVAAAWSGEFIDYEAIHFNGVHGRHPAVAGDVHFANATGPGFGRPTSEKKAVEKGEVNIRFEDDRVVGRDGKHYGPLPNDWARYLGLYRYGKQTVLKYRVGDVLILETPGLKFEDKRPIYTRTLNLEKRTQDISLRVADVDGELMTKGATGVVAKGDKRFVVAANGLESLVWLHEDGQLRLTIPPGPAVNILIACTREANAEQASVLQEKMTAFDPVSLKPMIGGGPPAHGETLTTKVITGKSENGFAVDVLERPKSNPWNCRLRMTGLDFLPGNNSAVVTTWDGSVWMVSGFGASKLVGQTLSWRRFASGLFQPLGVKYHHEKIYVTCRDQIVVLHDQNQDGEADWYENFNSDHQVTEHFHEFAAGLQVDRDGNFYYAKCACHARKAVVPHHGTILKIDPEGKATEIVANGFRAANGVCLNDDGTFFVTDQEGHWTPKNRINLVKKGGFYGNLLGYHHVKDQSDAGMEKPVCWITNAFDRSPSELLWVTSERWKPLKGSLLNLSYGYGQIYTVPHETIDGQMQGGMVRFPMPRFPTGIMRGRFHPQDGQLYCCGMFAWAGNQKQPGGLYRIRYTGGPVHLLTGLNATPDGMKLTFSDPIDRKQVKPDRFKVAAWDLKRTANYGSKHLNERKLDVTKIVVSQDGRSISLTIDGFKPTRGMKIHYSLRTEDGKKVENVVHHSVHVVPKK